MNNMEIICKNEKQTAKFAKKFASLLKGGEIILLIGDLGAGKTTFTKSLAKALKIKEHITSPTFTIVNEYHSGKLGLYHFDMYRIEDISEVVELGLNEYFSSNYVCVIEWPERIGNLIPKKHIKIEIKKLGETERKFLVSFIGYEEK